MAQSRENQRALLQALADGDTQKLVSALEDGATEDGLIDVSGPLFSRPIKWPVVTLAAIVGSCEAVDALVQRGADVNAQDGGGQTALMWACMPPATEARVGMVRHLISLGANVSVLDKTGGSALDIVVEGARPFLSAHKLGPMRNNPVFAVARLLLDAGARSEKAATRELLTKLVAVTNAQKYVGP